MSEGHCVCDVICTVCGVVVAMSVIMSRFVIRKVSSSLFMYRESRTLTTPTVLYRSASSRTHIMRAAAQSLR